MEGFYIDQEYVSILSNKAYLAGRSYLKEFVHEVIFLNKFGYPNNILNCCCCGLLERPQSCTSRSAGVKLIKTRGATTGDEEISNYFFGGTKLTAILRCEMCIHRGDNILRQFT
jgi:hypothetical protein